MDRIIKVDNLKISGTGSLIIPIGSNSNRPATPEHGSIRYNTDISDVEIYNGSWESISLVNPDLITNIKDYGALGDGVADDTTAFINAITAAQSLTGQVFFPKGKYRINTGNIELQNITLLGCSVIEKGIPYNNDGSVILLTGTTNSPFILGRGVTIEGLNFFYPNQTEDNVTPIVYPPLFLGAEFCTNNTIANCTIVNSYHGFKFEGITGDIRINNCRIYCVDRVFWFTCGAPDIIRLTDNGFYWGPYEDVTNVGPTYRLRTHTATYGEFIRVDVAGSDWDSIDGLTTSNNIIFGYRYGIRVLSGSLDVGTINGNFLDACPTALSIEGSSTINGCQFNNNTFYSYKFGDSAANYNTINIVNNTSDGSLQMVGNTFEYSQGSFIWNNDDGLTKITLVGNKFSNWGTSSTFDSYYAMVLVGPNLYGSITGNQFYGLTSSNLENGIFINNVANLVISSNQFHNCYVPIRTIQTGGILHVFNNTGSSTIYTKSFINESTSPALIYESNNFWDKSSDYGYLDNFIVFGQTTDDTQTELFQELTVDRIYIQLNSTRMFTILVSARNTETGEGAGYKISGAIRRDILASSTTLVGIPVIETWEDAGAATWDATVIADSTNGSLNVMVTGEDSKTINWKAKIQFIDSFSV